MARRKPAPVKEVETLPTPKTVAATKTKMVATTIPLPAASIDTITIEDLITRRYNIDIDNLDPVIFAKLIEVMTAIDNYEETMANGNHIDEARGESQQKLLFKNYIKIFLLENTLHRDIAMDYLLWKFYKNEYGSFSVTSLSRFTRHGRWITEELQMYLKLNHIFYTIREPVGRINAIKSISLSAVISTFPAERSRATESFLSWAKSIK